VCFDGVDEAFFFDGFVFGGGEDRSHKSTTEGVCLEDEAQIVSCGHEGDAGDIAIMLEKKVLSRRPSIGHLDLHRFPALTALSDVVRGV
jgi:hypothetical protein